MKKLLNYALPALFLGLVIAAAAHAQVVSPQYFKQVGTNLLPVNATNTIGSSTVNGSFKNLNVSGTCTGCGGSVTSSSFDPGAQVFNVKASPYNAKGDGVTDDYTAFNNAETAAKNAGGGIVFAPAGTYMFSHPLAMASNTSLYGSGMSSTIIALASSSLSNFGFSYLINGGGSNVTVQNLSLDGRYNQLVAPATNYGGLLATGNSWTVQNVEFRSSNYFKLWVNNASNDKLLRDIFDGTTGAGNDNFGGGGDINTIFQGNIFTAGLNGNAIDQVDGRGYQILNNYNYSSSSMYLEGSIQSTVMGNYNYGGGAIGIESDAGYNPPTVINPLLDVVDGNYGFGATYGALLNYKAVTSTVMGGFNTFQNNHFQSSTYSGILVNGCGGSLGYDSFTNNFTANSNQQNVATLNTGCGVIHPSGINISNDGPGVKVNGNTAIDTQSTSTQLYGIEFGQTSSPSSSSEPTNFSVANNITYGNKFGSLFVVSPTFSKYTASNNNNALIGYWPFDEATGRVFHDYTQFGNTASSTDSVGTSTDAVSGRALNFTGAQSVSIPSSFVFPTDQFTVSFWYKSPTKLDTVNSEAFIKQSGSFAYEEQSTNGVELYAYLNDPNDYAGALRRVRFGLGFTDKTNDNKWHNRVIAISVENGSAVAREYEDGMKLGGDHTVDYTGDTATPSGPTFFGNAAASNVQHFNGLMDELKIFNYALPSDQIEMLYKEGSNFATVGSLVPTPDGKYGLGTSQPSSTLHVVGNGIFTTGLAVGTTTTSTASLNVAFNANVTGSSTFRGGIVSTSTLLDSVGGTCGGNTISSSSIKGSNGIGRVTTGGDASSTCTITFGVAFVNKPVCTFVTETTNVVTSTLIATPSASSLIISMASSTLMKAATFDYICIGQ